MLFKPDLICAVTVNWNRRQETLECLKTLTAQTYPNFLTICVDNGSTDGSSLDISKQFPSVEQVLSKKNLGFSGGFNLGIQRALQLGAEQVFIINNDAIASSDCVETLAQYTAPDIGALAPLIYYAQPSNKIWAAGGRVNRWTLEKKDRYKDKIDLFSWPKLIEQDFLTGCALLLSRQAIETVGIFDEGFWAYYEDSDLCYRMRMAKFRLGVVPKAKIWHKVASSSGGSNSPGERYWMGKSSVRFFKKHARWWQIPLILVRRTVSALRTTIRLIFKKNWTGINAYWRGLRDGLFGYEREEP